MTPVCIRARLLAVPKGLVRPIDLIAYASDASFYRLIPKAVVLAKDLEEIRALFALSLQQTRIPLTFRAAGTSLSGQSISDGLLVEVARHWRELRVEEAAARSGYRLMIGSRQSGTGPLRSEDRPGPGLHRHLHHGWNPCQQFQRRVLRSRAERLSHPSFHDVHVAVGNRYWYTSQPGADDEFHAREPKLAGGILG